MPDSPNSRSPSSTRLVAARAEPATRKGLVAGGTLDWREDWIAAQNATDTTQDCIAAVFGVTRQRVGAIIAARGPSQAQLQQLAEHPATSDFARAYLARQLARIDRRGADRTSDDELALELGRTALAVLAPKMRKVGA